MNFNKQTSKLVLLGLLLIAGILTCDCVSGHSIYPDIWSGPEDPQLISVKSLNDSLRSSFSTNDLDITGIYARKLLEILKSQNADETAISESYYLLGIYYTMTGSDQTSIKYFSDCIAMKDKNGEVDAIYIKAYYNMGVEYSKLGNLDKFEICALKSLEAGRKIYNEFDPRLIGSYYSLGTAYIDMKEYEKSLYFMNISLQIANENPGKIRPSFLTGLYTNMGVIYTWLYDYSKAKIYYDKAESTYDMLRPPSDEFDYISLLRNLASNNNSRGEIEEAAKYYEKAVSLTMTDTSHHEYSIISNYANFLSNSKKTAQGEKLLRTTLEKVKVRFGINDRNYNEVLAYYGNFLRENKIDYNKSLDCFKNSAEYVRKNEGDLYMKNMIITGYALSLKAVGKSEEALEIIQALLFNEEQKHSSENPPLEKLKPDLTTLKILKIKYSLLRDIYRKTGDSAFLKSAAATSELVVNVLDKVRINISEEESRLILGDKYRESYLNVIRDFNLLYNITGENHYFETAFQYSEKSKVAGLLTSTRELKAAQLQIPDDVANLEKDLQRSISLYEVRIADESSSKTPRTAYISGLKESLLKAVRKRDSLILVFEKNYPGYYAIKFNTHVAEINDIPGIVGKNGNYVNYILSDSLIYTFVINRDQHKLLVQRIDSSFFNDMRQFRNLLSKPSPSENATSNFKEYQRLGYSLYKTLVEPVRKYFISDRVIISPDNFLSYLPFEAFLTSIDQGNGIRYKDLKYLMNDLDISYTYSATFLSEMAGKKTNNTNNLIAFAPDYPESIDIQSVMMSRQGSMGSLNDLPYARQEAEYVSGITEGKLFLNKEAKESVFKKESGNFDIIHLAMHTLLNDKDPMRSTLIFTHSNDSTEDGYLKTYEIYGIPLKAKMVVLSSCNTGTGMLYSGEGILSLARGFIYSGSLSVVMSMWEIEDKSGTDVVKMFYDNLESGYSKSNSLKRARTAFLKNADQLRSHPYYWSSMVVYGNNSPIYHNKLKTGIISLLGLLILAGSVIYYRKRRYS
jgi:CHAT domain-containing protein